MQSLNAVIFYHVGKVPGAACPFVMMEMTSITVYLEDGGLIWTSRTLFNARTLVLAGVALLFGEATDTVHPGSGQRFRRLGVRS